MRRGIIKRDFVFGLAAVRRERFLAAKGFDESLDRGEDRDCWLRLILGGARAGLVDVPLARYRLGSSTLSSDRAANLRVGVNILERARGEQQLTEGEENFLAGCVRAMRLDAALTELEESLRQGHGEARSQALQVLRSSGFPYRTRAGGVRPLPGSSSSQAPGASLGAKRSLTCGKVNRPASTAYG